MSGPAYSAIILAGGDGTRLMPLTRALTGDDRPKQFCAVLGEDTLLDQTRRRARMLIDPARTLTVVTRKHERYYRRAIAGVAPALVVEQPENRGTAPAIVYALLRLGTIAPDDPVSLLPSDHYVSDDRVFMWNVEQALETVEARPHLTVLLGIAADRPEVEYGWIEPGDVVAGAPAPAYHVRRFWEKPGRDTAERLFAMGCFWNSFVIVARPATLLGLVGAAAPSLALPSIDFSRTVLTPAASRLAVVPVTGVDWNDLGDPGRVVIARQRLDRQVALA